MNQVKRPLTPPLGATLHAAVQSTKGNGLCTGLLSSRRKNAGQRVSHWETMLADVLQPLVTAGYLRWASLAQMGEAYQTWEQQCP